MKAQSGKATATRVVRQRQEPDTAPPPDYGEWRRSQDMSLAATRKIMEKRRKKKA